MQICTHSSSSSGLYNIVYKLPREEQRKSVWPDPGFCVGNCGTNLGILIQKYLATLAAATAVEFRYKVQPTCNDDDGDS